MTQKLLSFATVLAAGLNLAGCGSAPEDVTDASEEALSRPEIGVLLASHCDIDDVKTELEPYVKTAFLKNVGIPIPGWVRPALAGPAYALSYDTVKSQYDAIGPTKYRANAKLQVDATTAALRAAGVNGKAYLGCDFTWPTIPQALDEMRRDGVKRIVVLNKGAQYSAATGGEHMTDAIDYLKKNPTWNPQQFVMVKEFSSDARFRKLLGDVLERDVKAAFPGAPKGDVCILVASHGLPLRMVQNGDPATRQMQEVVSYLKGRFVGYDLRHGYLNDDFFPGAEWTTPKAITVAQQFRSESCPNVYMDARLSFTTDHRATLFDLNVEARAVLEEPDLQPNGQPHPLYKAPKIVFGKQFDGEPGLAKLFVDLTKEALAARNNPNVIAITRTSKAPVN